MEFDELYKQIDKIDGWMSREECEILYNLVKSNKPKKIIEIGSFKGRSAVLMANVNEDESYLIYAIDPHTGNPEHHVDPTYKPTYDAFMENIKGQTKIIPIKQCSWDVLSQFKEGDIDMVFIDGLHSFEAVAADAFAYYLKLKDSGVIAFHDSRTLPGGPKQVFELLVRNKLIGCIGFGDSVSYGYKHKFDGKEGKMLLMKSTEEKLALMLPRPVKDMLKKVKPNTH